MSRLHGVAKTDLTLGPTRCLGKHDAVNRPWRNLFKHDIKLSSFYESRYHLLQTKSSTSIIFFLLMIIMKN